MQSQDSISERGQAIVYLVLGLVVFFGFVALAIDGGMVLADRRHEQNAADAASLAGGAAAGYYLEKHKFDVCTEPWDCYSPAVGAAKSIAISQAHDRAEANGFIIEEDADLADHNGVKVTCGGNSFDNGSITVTVAISATTPSNFLQLVYPSALHNEVEAVTVVKSGGPYLFGDAIVALNEQNCADPSKQGVIIGGAGTVHVTGGNVFSNGCVRQDSPISVTIDAPYDAWGHSQFKSEDWSELTTDTIPPSEYEIKQPDCSTAPAGHNVDHKDFPTTTLPDGLWCVTGGDINISADLTGDGVTIVILEGKLVITGNPEIHLFSPSADHPDNTNTAEDGLLIYLPKSNPNAVTLAGTESSEFQGLVYAPSSVVKLTGTGENMFRSSQVVGMDVIIEGTDDLTLTYSGCDGYLRSPSIGLYK